MMAFFQLNALLGTFLKTNEDIVWCNALLERFSETNDNSFECNALLGTFLDIHIVEMIDERTLPLGDWKKKQNDEG